MGRHERGSGENGFMGSTEPLPGAEAITWETNISLLTNPLILKQSALVAGGSGLIMAFLMTVIFAATGEFRAIPMMWFIALCVTGGLAVLFSLVALIFFGNRFRVRFTVDNTGALWETIDKRAIAAGRLALVAGILGRSPQVAGAGAIALSREKEFVRWKEIAVAEYNPRRLMITLRNSWRPVMLIVCTPENYDRVAEYIHGRIVPPEEDAASRGRRKPLARGLLRTALVTLAVLPLLTLSGYPFELDLLLPLILYFFALATVWLVPLFGWVVIGCALILAMQLTLLGLAELPYLYGGELAAFFLACAGLIFLAWYSWGYLRRKRLSILMEE